MNISIPDVKCTVIAHKYAMEIKHTQLEQPFRLVVSESIKENTGEELGWYAAPEIQLRQTVDEKQEYIMSNVNPTIEDAIKELLIKMAISSSKRVFYKPDFEEKYNRLW